MPRKFANTAADPLLPKTPLVVDGKTYYLCFDYRALREAETAFMAEGHRSALVAAFSDPFSFESVSRVLPCALRRFHPGITWEEAESLVNLGNVSQIAGIIFEAREAALPKPEKTAGEESPVNPTEP